MAQLPDLMKFNDGRPVTCSADWPARRAELLDAVIDLEYGGLPPTPIAGSTSFHTLHQRAPESPDTPGQRTMRITTGPAERPISFILKLLWPATDKPLPVVLHGDACWSTATDQVIADVLGRGYAFAQFNRTELAADTRDSRSCGGLYHAYPDGRFGALAAWAYGYHRCVDVLCALPFIDAARIAIIGHSRGGKATLLAGATDTRIALTGSNNSGAGGAGCFHLQGPNSETLADLLKNFPFWFGPDLPTYLGRENQLPFDQHFLKAAIAPRALITLEARGDLWANPSGTQLTHDAALHAWQLHHAADQLAIVYRDGGHAHGPDDWRAFLDFADRVLR